MNVLRIYLLLLSCLFATVLSAQGLTGSRNQDKVLLLNFSYGPVLPIADMAKRFDPGFSVEVSADFAAEGSPWFFGFMGQYFFGNNVNEDVLQDIRLANGTLVSNQRTAADINLRLRGLFAGARASKIFSFGENNRAGLKVSLGFGILSHRIRIQDAVNLSVPQFAQEYRKGYDRLTAGPAMYNFVGYEQLSFNGRVNFFAGFELITGITSSQRSFDFATAGSLKGTRLDMLGGARLGIILPFYIGDGEEIFYR